MSSDRPIFIVACPRSGTTLLQLMLSSHPRISIPPENRFLLEAYRSRRTFGNLSKPRKRAALADWLVARPKFKDLKLDRREIKARIVAAPPTLGSALGTVFATHAEQFGKPRWGDKRPLYLNHLPWLLELFPDAQIVNIVRDGRDCVASLKQMPWWKEGSVGAIARWVQSMRMGRRARRRLRPDQYYELQYERLVDDPRAELERLCAFLGEEFSERMLDHHAVAAGLTPGYKSWHHRTTQPVTTTAVNQWVRQLEPWEVAVLETLGRRHLRRYGYRRASRGLPPPGRLVRAVWDLQRRELSVARLHWRDRRRRRAYRHPVAARLTSGQRELAAGR